MLVVKAFFLRRGASVSKQATADIQGAVEDEMPARISSSHAHPENCLETTKPR
eukprot:SAG11_NODE_19099_length_474_cov_0.952000_2_plen_52_part_01